MQFINSFRKQIYLQLLRSRSLSPEKVSDPDPNLAKANIGLLFDGTYGDDRTAVEALVNELRNSGNIVSSLGYIDHDAVASTYSFKHFYRKHVNYFFIPKHDDIERFMMMKYHILINLGKQDDLPLHYIAKLTLSSFKIGPFNDWNNHYDIMIQSREKMKVDQLINEIKRILKNIQYHE